MTDQDSISSLKRKIVAVDKLIRNKNKTDAKNSELSAAVEEKNKSLIEKDGEILRLQAQISSEPLRNLSSSDNNNAVLLKDLEDTRKKLEEKTIKVAKFKEESVSRSQKIGQLEIELGKKTSSLLLMEKELNKRNDDIINRELESKQLRTEIDELRSANARLEVDINGGKHIESIKQSYEELNTDKNA